MEAKSLMTPALALLMAAGHVLAGWTGSINGTAYADVRNYTNTANWAGGAIDDDFTGVTLTGNTTLHFTGDHATGPGGINTSHAGNYSFALQGYGGDRTLKLNGTFTHQPALDKTLTLGATGNGLVLDLGGINCTFQVGIDSGTGRGHITMTRGLISNGGIVKTGRGTLNLNILQPYIGPTLVNLGSVTIAGAGSIRNSSVVHVRPTSSTAGADVNSHELVAGLNDRLGDSTPIVLSSDVGGSIRATFASGIWLNSGGSIDASEEIGPLIFRSGMVAVTHGYKYLNVERDINGYIRTDADALIRSNRTVAVFVTAHPNKETATFKNPAIGEWRTTYGTTNCGNRFVFSTPLPTIGGTNSRGTDSPVVPFLVGKDTSIVFNSNFADTILTCDANGLRALRTVTNIVGKLPEFAMSVAAANADGCDNVYVRTTETVAADETVNSLVMANASVRVNAGVRLTVRSGLVTAKAAQLGQDSSNNGVLDVGASEGVFIKTATGGSDGWSSFLSLAGSNGYTFAAYNSGISLYGTNSYSGQTTIACGGMSFVRKTHTENNIYFPDDGLVLVHPGATLQVGNPNYVANEIVGSLGGGGTLRLGYISHPTPAYRHSLIIGSGGSGAPGMITLDGGVVAPGLENEVGTLFVTTEANSPNSAIPVTLATGTFQADIAGAGVCDVLSTMGAVNINAGGNLSIEVDVNRTKPSIGQQWTVLTSAIGPVSDGNGGKLVDAITDNSDRVNFTAAIALDGKSLVLTAIDANPGTVLIVR
jgi:hypothetical protein